MILFRLESDWYSRLVVNIWTLLLFPSIDISINDKIFDEFHAEWYTTNCNFLSLSKTWCIVYGALTSSYWQNSHDWFIPDCLSDVFSDRSNSKRLISLTLLKENYVFYDESWTAPKHVCLASIKNTLTKISINIKNCHEVTERKRKMNCGKNYGRTLKIQKSLVIVNWMKRN